MKKKLIALSGFVLGFAPVVALAAVTSGGVSCGTTGGVVSDIPSLLCKFSQLLNSVIPVLIALGVVYFVWGVVSYVISDDEEAKKKGRDRIIYGIIGLAVIIAMWGLVGILTNTFGLTNSNNTNINLPSVTY
ncbi:MAG: pilin [Candidatus Paceibacterota bacterium]